MAKPSLANKLKAENDQLRDAARQLHAGLLEYAKEENWKKPDPSLPDGGVWEWKGDGEGPKTAKYYLGLLEEAEQN